MTTDAARQTVLNTSELLERIILHLPMKNIFAVQRVSHKFKAVADTSPSIQTKVFRRLQNTQRRRGSRATSQHMACESSMCILHQQKTHCRGWESR
jgi:hypothetical protein